MLRHFTISKRVIFLIVLMVGFALGACGGLVYYLVEVENESAVEAERVLLDGYKRTLQFSVQTIATRLGAAVKKAEAEGSDPVLAMRETIQPVRYGTKGYYFIYDTKGRNMAHPLRHDFHGKNRIGTKDKLGNPYIKQLAEKAKAGGGFVTYWFFKPGEKEPSPKLAYAEIIPGTDCFVATGIYIDDIKTQKGNIVKKLSGILQSALRNVGIAVGAVFLLLLLPLTICIVRSILRPLKEATAKAQKVAEGDLDVKVEARGNDEITLLENALNRMLEELSSNIHEIEEQSHLAEEQAKVAHKAAQEADEARRNAEKAKSEGMCMAAGRLEDVIGKIADVSTQISTQSEAMRQGAIIQSERIAETATAMEQMNATVFEVARSSSEAAETGTTARDKAKEGAEIVQNSVKSMQSIQDRTERLKNNMDRLGDQTGAIGAIMTVIEDIADQTNLLALNAAIEAARAGDAGRGFAVVADEVRKLAEKTMGATKEVGQTVLGIQDLVKENISAVDEAVLELVDAAKLTDMSGVVLEEIVDSSEMSATQIQSIATAAEEQSATSEEINRSVDDINRITTEATEGAVQTARAVRGLTEQMTTLHQLIEDLKQG
ncbi:MAG: methyl-accepting chemotaxis protein [Desulfovibrio sp.]|uniref:methyl-accepting chemotaxis protein n=1 Tax=Desulfovibrio sp. 7SRBS1 TaxID=3378064 RepID=UPI003B41EAFD